MFVLKEDQSIFVLVSNSRAQYVTLGKICLEMHTRPKHRTASYN